MSTRIRRLGAGAPMQSETIHCPCQVVGHCRIILCFGASKRERALSNAADVCTKPNA